MSSGLKLCIYFTRLLSYDVFEYYCLEVNWAPVAHACNPCYSGGRDQEDCSLKPAQGNSSRDFISKIPTTKKKRAGGVAQGVGPEFKPQYWKKSKTGYAVFPLILT
jgi:hypothetical protein